jgi:hypothetical protein
LARVGHDLPRRLLGDPAALSFVEVAGSVEGQRRAAAHARHLPRSGLRRRPRSVGRSAPKEKAGDARPASAAADRRAG